MSDDEDVAWAPVDLTNAIPLWFDVYYGDGSVESIYVGSDSSAFDGELIESADGRRFEISWSPNGIFSAKVLEEDE